MRPVSAALSRRPSVKGFTFALSGNTTIDSDNFWTVGAPGTTLLSSGPLGSHEDIGNSFSEYVSEAYKANGVVFTCILVRQLALSEARFQFQQMTNGRPGDLFDSQALSLLHKPSPNMTTGELIGRMEQDASLAGNFYATSVGGRLRRLRPDWVTIVTGVRGAPDESVHHIDSEVLGYIYDPKPARTGPRDLAPVFLTPDAVVHYSPIPDPTAQHRGMSWLTPVLREIDGDTAAMSHKTKFFRNGATSNLAVTYPQEMTLETFKEYVKLFNENHEGPDQAWKTMHFGSGADPKVLSMDLKQLDFKAVQGHGESRIAAAAGVGAIIARLPESLQGAGLMQGNFSSAMRQCADMTFRPLWRMMAGALESIVDVPSDARLWYDDRDIAFLQQDKKDASEIDLNLAQAIRTLTDGGFAGATAVQAIAPHWSGVLEHTGLPSVQVQAPAE